MLAAFHANSNEVFDIVSLVAKERRHGLSMAEYNMGEGPTAQSGSKNNGQWFQSFLGANYKYCLTPQECYQLQHTCHLQPSALQNRQSESSQGIN